jgi:hypothetical protein
VECEPEVGNGNPRSWRSTESILYKQKELNREVVCRYWIEYSFKWIRDSKLSIKGYEHEKPEIGDWSQIDDNYEDFQEVPQTDELDEFIRKRRCVLLRIIVDYYCQGCRNS